MSSYEKSSYMIVQEGENHRMFGRLYVVVVQSVMMFGSVKWGEITLILRVMGSLHNRATRRISDRIPQNLHNRRWEHPQLGERWRTLVWRKLLSALPATLTPWPNILTRRKN